MTFHRLCLIIAFIVLSLLPVQAEEVRLFILHTNDIHGHLEEEKGSDPTGGFIRLASVIRSIKAAFPGQVLLLDAGDTALGTPTSGYFKGIPVAKSMQSVGYDVVALGNHEFDWGKDALAAMMKANGAQILCANLVNTADGSYPYAPSTVIERNGLKIGIFGLVAPDTASRTLKSNTVGWSFLPAVPAAKKALAKLPQNLDAVIALTHIGVDADRALAQGVSGIDLIVGGHSHTALQTVVTENGVPIVQSGLYCHYLGVLEVMIDTEKKELKVLSYHLVPIDDSVAIDPQVAAIVESYAQVVRPHLDHTVGTAQAPIMNLPKPTSVDTPLGDFIADALAQQAQVDLAFYNRGGVRGHLASGPLTVRKLYEMFPFDDPVVVLTLKAHELEAVIRQGVTARAQLSPSHNLQVKTMLDGQLQITFRGKPLDQKSTYSIATTHFLATGGDHMSTLKDRPVKKVLPYVRDVLKAYIEAHPEIKTLSPTRIQRLEHT